MILTDEQYDLLAACFRNHYSNMSISLWTHIPVHRVERERERWVLCVAISELALPPTYKQLFNGGKTFGRRHLTSPRYDLV